MASKKIIALESTVSITAAKDDGDKKTPPAFEVTAYTGGAMQINGWDMPVVIDLAGLSYRKSLVANLDHDPRQRVGHVTDTSKVDGKLVLSGFASAATQAAREVVESAANGFVWQASVEVVPTKVIELAAGKTALVNGQEVSGPAYITRKGTLKGFGFVSHGADDNTIVSIAASADTSRGSPMDLELKKWIEAMGFDPETLTESQLAGLEANYNGRNKPVQSKITVKLADGLEAKKAEAERIDGITEIALSACDKRPYDIEGIKKLAEDAIEAKWSVDKFRLELLEASIPPAHTVFRSRKDERLNNRVIEAAICVAGRLPDVEKHYDDQTLQAAHDKFKGNIGLKQLFLLAAESRGYRASYASDVTLEVQRAAFGMTSPQHIQAAAGWSYVELSSILSNTANKFIREGWNTVDMTPMRIASIRNVRNFQQITTVSLVGDTQFEKLGAAGEIKHGTLGEVVYTNKADTYAKMLAITRQDIINDDLGALTVVPRKLGRGAGLKLNDIFWTAFLRGETDGFFASSHTNPTGNSNLNAGAADVTVGGLDATYTLFMNQIDPDGKPLGIMPAIMLVPTAQHAAALRLMNSELLIDGTSTGLGGNANVWRGRFRVETSPYMHNTAYTGYSTSAWYLMADPGTLPTIEIAALNGRVEPTIDTADADFNVLGVQMRGYSDVGVALQEYRACVKADGGSS